MRTNPRVVVRAIRAGDFDATRRLLAGAHIGAEDNPDLAGFFVAVSAGSIVGCGGFERCGRASILHSIVVDKKARRRGVGRRLVAAIIGCRSSGVQVVALMTMFWNVNFFRRVGFRTVSRRALPESL